MLSSPQGFSCTERVAIKREDDAGFCFTDRSPDDFRDAAAAFLCPIRKTMRDRAAGGQTHWPDRDGLLAAALRNFPGQVFDGTLETVCSPDRIRRGVADHVSSVFPDAHCDDGTTVHGAMTVECQGMGFRSNVSLVERSHGTG